MAARKGWEKPLLELCKEAFVAQMFGGCLNYQLCGACMYCRVRSLLERADPKWLASVENRQL
jgi:hypothetical protein